MTAQITPFLNFIAAAVLLCFVIAIADGEALTARCEVRGTAQNIVVHLGPSARNPLLAAGFRMHLHAGATEAARGSFGRRDGRLLSWIGLPALNTSMPAPLVLVDAALRGMVVALLLLAAGLMLRDRPRLPAAQAGALLTVGLIVQVFSSTPSFEQRVACSAQSPLVGISVANAVLFWLFVRTLFDDDFRWRPWQLVVWALAFTVGALNCNLLTGAPTSVTLLLRVLLRSVPLAAALLAVQAAAQHWREDLVEARRRLRFFVLVTGVAYTLVQLGLRLGAPDGRLSDRAALVDMSILLVIAVGVVWRLLQLASTELFLASTASLAPAHEIPPAEDVGPRPLPPPDAAEQRLGQALHTLMRHERAYRSENLTVASLAAKLSVPEYRLRRHINQRLGHRNFNAYVNGLRLDEAKAALADPAARNVPVLTIALTAGFQSIGPFNRAFKAVTGMTPTEFRKENIADS